MKIAAVRFRRPVFDAGGKPIERLKTAELKDELVRAGDTRYPLHMVASFRAVDVCPVCGEPFTAKQLQRGNKVCSKSCAAKMRGDK